MPRYDFGHTSTVRDYDSLIAEIASLCFYQGVDNRRMLGSAINILSEYFHTGIDKVHPVKFVIALAIYKAFCELNTEQHPPRTDQDSSPWLEINRVGQILAEYLKKSELAFQDTEVQIIRFYLHSFARPQNFNSVGPAVFILINTPS